MTQGNVHSIHLDTNLPTASSEHQEISGFLTLPDGEVVPVVLLPASLFSSYALLASPHRFLFKNMPTTTVWKNQEGLNARLEVPRQIGHEIKQLSHQLQTDASALQASYDPKTSPKPVFLKHVPKEPSNKQSLKGSKHVAAHQETRQETVSPLWYRKAEKERQRDEQHKQQQDDRQEKQETFKTSSVKLPIGDLYIRFMALMEKILGQAEAEAHSLYQKIKHRTDDVETLTKLLGKINNSKGNMDWSKDDQGQALLNKARELGVEIPNDKTSWTDDEKKMLKENIQMRKDSMEKITQLERTDMQRFLQEAATCHQTRSNMLKLRKEAIDTIVANIRP